MTGNYDQAVGQRQQLVTDGRQDLPAVAAREIGAADGVAEQGVAGDEFVLRGRQQADAPLRMARGVEHLERMIGQPDLVAIPQRHIEVRLLGGLDAQPAGLYIQMRGQVQIALVHVDRSARAGVEAGGAADMIDVGVGDDDGGDPKLVAVQDLLNFGKVVPGVDDHGLTRRFIAEDGTIALQHPHRQDLVDHHRYNSNVMIAIDVLMQWLHLLGAAVLVGGAIYGRVGVAPVLMELGPEARAKAMGTLVARMRPVAFAAVGAVLLSGLWNLVTNFSGKTPAYHMLLGVKLLLALHVMATAFLLAVPPGANPARDARRPRLLAGMALSGILILLISACLRRGF